MRIRASFLLILFISISFAINTFFIFKFHFDEDELEFVRYSILMMNGKIPFIDFISLSFPLFHVFLIPIIKIFSNDEFLLIKLKLFFLFLSFLSLIPFYKSIKITFSKNIATLSTIIFSLSFVFLNKNLLIRPPSITLILFSLTIFIAIKKRNLFNLISIILIVIILCIDLRFILPFLSFIIFLVITQNKKAFNYFIIIIPSFITICILTLLFINYKLPKFFAHLFQYIPFKEDQKITYFLWEIKSDILILIMSIYGLKELIRLKDSQFVQNMIMIIFSVIFLFVLFFYRLRPSSFGIYFNPFICLSAACGLERLNSKLKRFSYFPRIDIFIIIFFISQIFIISIETKKIANEKDLSFLSNNDQMQIIKNCIHENKNGGSVMNLSRFPLNLYGYNTFPILRFEEDNVKTIYSMKLEKFVFDILLNQIKQLDPNLIIYSKSDEYLPSYIKDYINKNYSCISKYLFRKKIDNYSTIEEKDLNKENRKIVKNFILNVLKLTNFKESNINKKQ